MTMLGTRVGLSATIVAHRHCKKPHFRSASLADMSDPFTKLFQSILSSTIWAEESDIRVVWITMLAMADQDGYVGASIPGLAKQAGVTLAKAEEALTKFMSPDPYSRTKKLDGRRIVEADRGWILVNYPDFRRKRDEELRREANRLYKQASRERSKMSAPDADSQQCQPRSAQAEAEADQEAEAELGDHSPYPPSAAERPEAAAPPAREKRSRPRTRLPAEGTWTEDQASRLLAVGRSPLQEEQAFRAHHEAKGSLMASWTAARTTWVLGAEKGYGAPKQSNHARPTADDNVRRQFERVRQLEAAERGRALP